MVTRPWTRSWRRAALAIAIALMTSSAWTPATVNANGEPTRLLRTPTVSAKHVAFAYANNIWVADRAGGSATRLTSFQGQSSNPKFSPDGALIAFSAEYAGNTDVYVVAVDGGEPRRLTWHPGADTVQGWTPDGTKVLFASGRATWAPSAAPRFWTVPVSGGVEEPLPIPRAYQGKISADGRRLAYRLNTSWDEERRNYRGGQNKPIWIVDLASYDLVTPPWKDSKDTDPVWIGDRVFFISDRDGVANVWSFDLAAKQLQQLTRFTDFDVKSLEAGAGVLVFEQAGLIHEWDPKTNRAKTVTIRAAGDFPWMMTRWEDVSARMTNIALSPTGKRVLAEARGEIFTVPAEKGDVRNITNSSGSAERAPAWSPDGKWISYFSDKSGEYQLIIESQDGISPAREVSFEKPSFYYTPSWSPDSSKLLYTDTNLNVWVMDVKSGKARIIGNDPWMVPQRTLHPSWSPDSKYVAFATRLNTLFRAIVVANVETGQRRQITDGLADTMYPVWDASGKYLWFLASTDLGLRSQWLDMTSYDREVNFALYLAVLKNSDPSPLLPESDEDPGVSAAPPREREEDDNASPRTPVTVEIDFEGLQQRILPVPGVPERQYAQLKAGAAGTVYFLEAPAGPGSPNRGNTLHRYRLRDRRSRVFVNDVAEYALSADGRKLLYRTPGPSGGPNAAAATSAPPVSLFLIDALGAPPSANQGRLNVSLRMHLDPKEEFRQIFDEGWRLQRDYLYVTNAHGSDWPRMKQMYSVLLPHVRHRADLNYLLDNMGAELAVGHSYVRGGAMPEVPTPEGGLLGADFVVEQGRYKIARIYDGESWNPDLRAPLAAPGINVNVGDFIVAINGVELVAPDNIYRLLDGTANRQTVLSINTQPTRQGARQVTVVPVPNEQGLRTRAWVESNRRLVEKLSNGKLAYVYVPNTAQGGYVSFNRYYFAQQDKQGAVIDERFNGGGSAADYIIDVLQRDFDGYFNNVAGDRRPFTSPSAGIWGPKVMIINEMAGSGGDLMPYMFRRRKIGPLVGTRTWGGLVHTADTPPFIDGGSMIAPRGGFFTRDGQWAVENEGVGADIEVENFPKDVIAGRDPQLERAIAEAMKLLEATPVDRRTTEPAPPRWGARPPGR